jgi:hypothetical protein
MMRKSWSSKKQQEYYRFIIENGGVVEQAEAQYQAMERLEIKGSTSASK